MAAFLRFYDLSEPQGLRADEAYYANDGFNAHQAENYQVYYAANNGREGLYINAIGVIQGMFGRELEVLRVPGALVGVLSVFAIYFLTIEISKRMRLGVSTARVAGLIAATVLATNFFHIYFSRSVYRGGIVPGFEIFALYFALRAFALDCKASGKISEYGICVIAGIVFGLGFHTYPAFYVMMPIMTWLVIDYYVRTRNYKKPLVFIALSLVAVAPLLWFAMTQPDVFFTRHNQVAQFDPLNNIHSTLEMLFNFGSCGRQMIYQCQSQTSYAVLLATMIGACILLLRKNAMGIVVLIWFGLALAPLTFTDFNNGHSLRMIGIIPPLAIITGLAVALITRNLSQRLIYSLIFVFLALLTFEASRMYFSSFLQDKRLQTASKTDTFNIARELKVFDKEEIFIIYPITAQQIQASHRMIQAFMFAAKTDFLDEQNRYQAIALADLPKRFSECQRDSKNCVFAYVGGEGTPSAQELKVIEKTLSECVSKSGRYVIRYCSGNRNVR